MCDMCEFSIYGYRENKAEAAREAKAARVVGYIPPRPDLVMELPKHVHTWERTSPRTSQPTFRCLCGVSYSDRANY